MKSSCDYKNTLQAVQSHSTVQFKQGAENILSGTCRPYLRNDIRLRYPFIYSSLFHDECFNIFLPFPLIASGKQYFSGSALFIKFNCLRDTVCQTPLGAKYKNAISLPAVILYLMEQKPCHIFTRQTFGIHLR